MPKNIQTYLLIIFITCIGNLSAKDVDSLKRELQNLGASRHPDILDLKSIICNDIAVAYQGIGENQKARTFFMQSIAFTKERINKTGIWDTQNNYDMASLYRNLAIFEATMGNHEQSQTYMNTAESFYLKLKAELSEDEYRSIMTYFCETNFVRYYHSEEYELADVAIKKSIELSKSLPIENQLRLQRLLVELRNAEGRIEEAENLGRHLLAEVDQKADPIMINDHQFVHT